MSKSRRLTLTQARAVHRLVDECRELGDDPRQWRRHLLAGVNALAGSAFALTAELRPAEPRATQIAGFAAVGLSDREVLDGIVHFEREGGFFGYPVTARFAALPEQKKTRLRRELVADADWYRSGFFAGWHRRVGLDDSIISSHAGPGGWGFLLCPNRAHGDQPFGRRDAVLIHFVQLELTPHLGRALATSRDPLARLSPRLRETLGCLLDGDGEKQAAARLGISPATVREYVQALYRHLGVTTRAELLAHFLRRFRRPAPPPAG